MSVPDEREEPNLRNPERTVPPQTPEIAVALEIENRKLCHCLDCGRQLVAIRHGDACLFCGSKAIVVE